MNTYINSLFDVKVKVEAEKDDEAKLNVQPVINNVTLLISHPDDLNIFITILIMFMTTLTILINIYNNIIISIVILLRFITISYYL